MSITGHISQITESFSNADLFARKLKNQLWFGFTLRWFW